MKTYFFLMLILHVIIIPSISSNQLGKIKLQKQLIQVKDEAHPCLRECVLGESKTCSYTFLVDTYTTMSVLCADCPYNITACSNPGCITGGGISRPVVNVNRRVPGPPIQVCENDTVIVDVINGLKAQVLTIHWHGIHQINSSYMDGAPYITQCPILPSNSFRYKFLAYPHGTHMWHGHIGYQEADGLFGAFVVRHSEPKQIKNLYDFDLAEHIITIWHWYDKTNDNILPPTLHRNESMFGFGLLINDKAALKIFKTENGSEITTPKEKFIVAQGKRYRFRVISNSAIYCPVEISVDNHTLIVISSETTAFEPVTAESLMINAGERFSFVIEANQVEGCYWMRFRGMGDCGRKSNVHEEAYLCYEGYDEMPSGTINYEDGRRSGVIVNPFEVVVEDYSNNTLVFLNNLTSVEPELYDYSGTPDVIIYLQFSSRFYDYLESPGPWPQFNNISFEFPTQSLLTQRNQLEDSRFCGAVPDTNHCEGEFCSCMYMHKVPLNALVEVALVDGFSVTQYQDHPIHLHGYKFHVVAMGVLGEDVSLHDFREMNEHGTINKKLENAVAKDTISVPDAGYAIVRFVTDNPGFWLFHCHVSSHMELGMATVLQVGNYSDMADPPPNFPTCGTSFYNIEEYYIQSYSSGNPNKCLMSVVVLFLNVLYLV